MRLILGLYTSWDDYEITWPGLTLPGQHLKQLEVQLEEAASLGTPVVRHVNIHSGCDSWDHETAATYFEGAAPLTSAFLETCPWVGGASHETHRGRALFHPYTTRRLLERCPELRLTADLSHWHVSSERILGLENTEEASWLRESVAPRVDHVHARVGGTQSPQISASLLFSGAEDAKPAIDAHVSLWKAVWDSKLAAGADEVLITPEYGPAPYQSEGDVFDLWNQTDGAARHIEATFAEWEATATAQAGPASRAT